MEPSDLRALLDDVARGTVDPAAAAERLADLPFADLGFARVDHHRALRQGMAEAVYAPGKTPAQAAAIVTELLSGGTGPVLLTRAGVETADAAEEANPGAVRHRGPVHDGAPTETLVWRPAEPRPEKVVVAAAGTSDLAVAGECVAMLEAHGVGPVQLSDVGVSGLEMSQNTQRLCWTREEVDAKLHAIMRDIHENCVRHASKGKVVNYLDGANIAGFVKVADAMLAQGVI